MYRSAICLFTTYTLVSCSLAIFVSASNARPLEQHFDNTNSCYERVYSSDHLSAHVGQRVSEIRFEHFPTTFGAHDKHGKIKFDPINAELYFSISVKFRGSDQTFSDSGICAPEGDRYRCQIECDGGSFYLTDRSDTSLLLINMSGFAVSGCDAENYRILEPEPDDKLFRLDRLPDHACMPTK